MPNTSLLTNLQQRFPQFRFEASDRCAWQPSTQTIFFREDDTDQLFHELGHAMLGHDSYTRDLDLIIIERDAWHEAQALAQQFGQRIDSDTREDALDTYRDWLHARSRCPRCDQTGIQTKKLIYSCLICRATWQVNDARVCGLRRQLQPQHVK